MRNSEPRRRAATLLVSALLIGTAGCGGEPAARELKNRQEFEMLLTAVSLRSPKQLETDASRIDDRHAAGELSDAPFADLNAIIALARSGRWDEAEKLAYAFREAHPYFK